MPFKNDPLNYITGQAREVAVENLRTYYRAYDGRYFDELADSEHPNQITASDLIALYTLGGLTVPAEAAMQLIRDEVPDHTGRIHALLAEIPMNASVWDPSVDYLACEPARGLWKAVRSLHDVARTKTSKLLAAKRPLLFPVYDQYVGGALLEDPSEDDWVLWRERFTAHDAEALLDACESVRAESGIPTTISPLRVLDVAIWMMEKP